MRVSVMLRACVCAVALLSLMAVATAQLGDDSIAPVMVPRQSLADQLQLADNEPVMMRRDERGAHTLLEADAEMEAEVDAEKLPTKADLVNAAKKAAASVGKAAKSVAKKAGKDLKLAAIKGVKSLATKAGEMLIKFGASDPQTLAAQNAAKAAADDLAKKNAADKAAKAAKAAQKPKKADKKKSKKAKGGKADKKDKSKAASKGSKKSDKKSKSAPKKSDKKSSKKSSKKSGKKADKKSKADKKKSSSKKSDKKSDKKSKKGDKKSKSDKKADKKSKADKKGDKKSKSSKSSKSSKKDKKSSKKSSSKSSKKQSKKAASKKAASKSKKQRSQHSRKPRGPRAQRGPRVQRGPRRAVAGWGISPQRPPRVQQRLPEARLTGAAATLTRANVRCVLCQFIVQKVKNELVAGSDDSAASASLIEAFAFANAEEQSRITSLVEVAATTDAKASALPQLFESGPDASRRFRHTDVLASRASRARFTQVRAGTGEDAAEQRAAYLQLYSSVYASFEGLCAKRMPLAYLPYCNDMLKSYRFFAQGINYGDRAEQICMNANFCDHRSYVRTVTHNAYQREPGDA